jgi:transcription-repair coupling factor (superfamily II helicase)
VLARQVAKLDAGPKGAAMAFRDDRFANPEGLIAFIREHVLFDAWDQPLDRRPGCRR